LFDRGENGISLLGITGYAIIEVDGKYVMVEMLLGACEAKVPRCR
jgi:hypothetical protein